MKKKINLNIIVLFIWLVPVLMIINILFNISSFAKENYKESLMNSIPKNCQIKKDEMICGTIVLKKEELKVYQGFKKQLIDLLEDKESYKLMFSYDNMLFNLIPKIKTFKEQNYKFIHWDVKKEKISKSFKKLALNNISNQKLNDLSCEMLPENKNTIIKNKNNIEVVSGNDLYFCGKEEKEIINKSDLLLNEFLKECYVMLVMNEKEPIDVCTQIAYLIEEDMLKEVDDKFFKDIGNDFEKFDIINMKNLIKNKQ